MPYKVEERGSEWVVINVDTQEVKAHHDTKEAAERQVRLLHAIENDPNWEPSGKD